MECFLLETDPRVLWALYWQLLVFRNHPNSGSLSRVHWIYRYLNLPNSRISRIVKENKSVVYIMFYLYSATVGNAAFTAKAADQFTNSVAFVFSVVYTIYLALNDILKRGYFNQNCLAISDPVKTHFCHHSKARPLQKRFQLAYGIAANSLQRPKNYILTALQSYFSAMKMCNASLNNISVVSQDPQMTLKS